MRKAFLFFILLAAVLSACNGRYNRMRHDLLVLSDKNQADTVFTSATESNRLVDYFSRHGSPNDRMLAYYLQGRAYSDMNDAPMAMECFKNAIEAADTASDDCDKKQLGIVTFQLGKLYYYQSLYDQSLEVLRLSSAYSFEGGDTLGALVCQGLAITVCQRLGRTDSVMDYTERLARDFHNIGRDEYASSYLLDNAERWIDRGEYAKAKQILDNYEQKSGFFDSCGNIEKGREVYYYIKGNYYMAVGQHDSAVYWFRKELRDGRDFNNQNAASRGLAMLYQRINQPDSAAKYAIYSYEMNDSVYAQMATEMVSEASARYDYTHNQLLAQKKEKELSRKRFWLWVMGISVVALAVIAYLIYYIMRERLRAEVRAYQENLAQLEKARQDLRLLRSEASNAAQLIAAKEQTIRQLEITVRQHEYKTSRAYKEKERQIKESPIYAHLQKLSSKGEQLNDQDLKRLENYLSETLPDFMSFLSEESVQLSRYEFHTCLLIRMYFKPSEVSNMLGYSAAYATKIRFNLLQKLFRQEGHAKDFDRLLRQI